MNPFMAAHGSTAGPTQRPLLAGMLSGAAAVVLALPLIWWSGAATSLGRSLDLRWWVVLILYIPLWAVAGTVYGSVFRRAANDYFGGWLFGIAYGFLLWLIGPVTLLQWIFESELIVGIPAVGAFGANLIWGLAMGGSFPWIHDLIVKDFLTVRDDTRPRPTESKQLSRGRHAG